MKQVLNQDLVRMPRHFVHCIRLRWEKSGKKIIYYLYLANQRKQQMYASEGSTKKILKISRRTYTEAQISTCSMTFCDLAHFPCAAKLLHETQKLQDSHAPEVSAGRSIAIRAVRRVSAARRLVLFVDSCSGGSDISPTCTVLLS